MDFGSLPVKLQKDLQLNLIYNEVLNLSSLIILQFRHHYELACLVNFILLRNALSSRNTDKTKTVAVGQRIKTRPEKVETGKFTKILSPPLT